VAEYDAAIKKDPKSVPAHMGLAIMYEIQKKPEQAKEYYLKILKSTRILYRRQ